MANLTISGTGVDHLYPDGVPLYEVEITITDIYKKIARISSLAVQVDPWFARMVPAQKLFASLHGEGDRITADFLEEGAKEILPTMQSLQRWITADSGVERFEFNSAGNPGKIIYRWQNMDTRLTGYKTNYTAQTLIDIRTEPNIEENVKKYITDALKDYVLLELYKAIGHKDKQKEYFKEYEQNRQYVAFWVKNDKSLQTQYNYAGV